MESEIIEEMLAVTLRKLDLASAGTARHSVSWI